MNKLLLVSCWVAITSFSTVNQSNQKALKKDSKEINIIHTNEHSDPIKDLYNEMQLSNVVKWEAFENAMLGYNQLNPKNKNILTIIDFTLPSTEKRMYVIDLKAKKLLFHNIVSHGRNSGEKFAVSFSNRHGSFQSSLGFYQTEGTYQGGNGYSLRLNGLEKGINDQALARAIVIHGADYCSQSVINATGRLGRSYGCPALPRELNKPIINTIKDGSLLFIYAKNRDYLASSKLLKHPNNEETKAIMASQEVENNSQSKAIMN